MSKFKAIEVMNFMAIKEARLEFDESNIISLCGYNDSGKSAITRALEILFYNSYTNDQVKFIKDGEDFFGIGLEDENGISVNYYKYRNGKSVWEMLKGKDTLYTNRLANGVAAVSDIPKEIAEYLGVIEDSITGEKLNVRRNTDRLFLIDTTGGDNYKILNAVLQTELLAEASKRLNGDKNILQAQISSDYTVMNTLKSELESLEVVDDSLLDLLENSIEKLTASKLKADYIKGIKEQSSNISNFSVYDELSLIDTSRLKGISSVVESRKIADIKIPAKVDLVSVDRFVDVVEVKKLRGSLRVSVAEEVKVVDLSRFKDIRSVGELYNTMYNVNNDLVGVTSNLAVCHSELRKLSETYGFKICKSCSAVVE